MFCPTCVYPALIGLPSSPAEIQAAHAATATQDDDDKTLRATLEQPAISLDDGLDDGLDVDLDQICAHMPALPVSLKRVPVYTLSVHTADHSSKKRSFVPFDAETAHRAQVRAFSAQQQQAQLAYGECELPAVKIHDSTESEPEPEPEPHQPAHV
jgi:hypothetical protein